MDVSVEVEKKATAGSFSFILGAALEEAPDQVVSSPTVVFEVPEPKKPRFPWWIAIVAVVALLLLAGGAVLIWNLTRTPPPPSPAPALPAAAWLSDGRAVAIVTQGGATCAPTVGEITEAADTLEIELLDQDDESCSADGALRASLAIPAEQLNMTEDHRIVLRGDYEGLVTLPGDPDGESPSDGSSGLARSAGWFSSDDFVLLTFGSSSCPLVIESAEVTAEDEVTVSLPSPVVGKACTRDRVGRVTVIETDGSGLGDGPVSAVIPRGGSDDVRVPIRGLR
ncbi:hypothetical protein ACPW96_19140 [Micromonospora sp. DT81.3]|uniref:hypothetical protein n=1 Tax=Micromonospora sp. DT81.3 TaxID=3416523 RepID=UPI003CF11E44